MNPVIMYLPINLKCLILIIKNIILGIDEVWEKKVMYEQLYIFAAKPRMLNVQLFPWQS